MASNKLLALAIACLSCQLTALGTKINGQTNSSHERLKAEYVHAQGFSFSKDALLEDPSLLFNGLTVARKMLVDPSVGADADQCSQDVSAMLADYDDRKEWARRSEDFYSIVIYRV